MIEIYGYSIATLPVIVAMVYGIIEFLKVFVFNGNETFKTYIPIVASAIGGVIGVVVFFVQPEIMPVATWYSAVLMGAASGLSAVGVNQIKKQLEKGDVDIGSQS